ncbi:MAG: SixA phosphatase family protein [Dongiales bacterium]|jgi:phosphohistidine phosphatase
MKRLSLLRHAKSDRSDPAAADFDRGLTNRGRQAAPAMGRYLRRQKLVPDIVLCSAARRARETWELAAAALKAEIPVEYSERLYLATPAQILRLLHQLPETTESALLIGHNPGFHALALQLLGSGDGEARAQLQAKFPTAALAVIDFEVERWGDLAAGKGKLERFLAPRDLD